MDDRKHRFRIIYDDTYDDLWRYCLRRCATSAHAEDVLGETFAVAWRRCDDLPDPPGARPYLFGIARNLIRDHYRRSDRDERLTKRLQDATRSRFTQARDRTQDAAELADVLDALHQLCEDDQEILRLTAWEGVPHAEIATVLGCSVNAVAIRLHRARARLAEKSKYNEPSLSAPATSSSSSPSERNAS